MKKGNVIIRGLKGIFFFIGGIFVTGIGATAVMAVRNTKKLKQHENENNSVMSLLFQKEEISIRPDTQNAFITVLCSKADITVPVPEKESMNIEITSFAGKVTIDLPEDVTVRCDAPGYADLSRDGSKASPVINLAFKDCASALTVNYV